MRKITLDEKQSLDFVKKTYINPPAPNEALKEAASKYKNLTENEEEFKKRFAREVFGIGQ